RVVVGGDDKPSARRDEIKREIEKLDDDIAAADETLRAVNASRALSKLALERYVDAIGRAAGRGKGTVDDWQGGLAKCEQHVAACDVKRDALRRRIDGLKKKRAHAADDWRPKPTGQRTIAVLKVRVSGAGGR